MNEAARLIQESADSEANIIFGAGVDNSLKDEVRITVIATGFEKTAFPTRDSKRKPFKAPPVYSTSSAGYNPYENRSAVDAAQGGEAPQVAGSMMLSPPISPPAAHRAPWRSSLPFRSRMCPMPISRTPRRRNNPRRLIRRSKMPTSRLPGHSSRPQLKRMTWAFLPTCAAATRSKARHELTFKGVHGVRACLLIGGKHGEKNTPV